MTTSPRIVPRAPSKRLALVAALAACAGAQAEEQPWYIGASQAFTHETNVFRQEPKLSDNISSTGVLGGFHWRPGRQHLYLDGHAEDNRYSDLKQLNNTSHSVVAGLDWQTVEHLSGTLRYVTRQSLSDYTVFGTPTDRNLERDQEAYAGVRYGFVAEYGVDGSVSRRKSDYTLTIDRNNTSDVGSVGLNWGTPGAPLTLRVGARVTKGDAPNYRPLLPFTLTNNIPVFGPVEPDKIDRKDIDFTAVWVPSGASRLTGRVSLTRDNHTAPSRGNFSGVTGAATWDYQLTGKTTLRGSLIRDTGNEVSFLSLSQIGLAGLRSDNNSVDWTALLEAGWQATAKILVTASARYVHGTLDTIDGGGFGSNSNRVTLGASYTATRNITLGCSFLHDGGGTSTTASVYGCSAQFVLR